jgi:gliding motility-associated lipoprotein GldD
MIKKLLFFLITGTILAGCGETFTPRPRGFYRIDFPEKKYRSFDTICPYTFEYPVYGEVKKDMEANAEPYWMNVEFPAFKAKIHLSYKTVHNNLDGFIEDSHKLAYVHAAKADDIIDTEINKPEKKVYGLVYEIEGGAASSVQFYLTDSVRHFLRGSLYFETRINKDSLAPAIVFFKKDVMHLIETLNWKNNK